MNTGKHLRLKQDLLTAELSLPSLQKLKQFSTEHVALSTKQLEYPCYISFPRHANIDQFKKSIKRENNLVCVLSSTLLVYENLNAFFGNENPLKSSRTN
jgi:hypothetical protein